MPEEFDDDFEPEPWDDYDGEGCSECGATSDELCDPMCSTWDDDE